MNEIICSHNIDQYYRTDPFRGGAKYHLDLCFYLGDDVKKSHVMCNAKWNNDTAEGWAQYINDLGFETEKLLSELDRSTISFVNNIQKGGIAQW